MQTKVCVAKYIYHILTAEGMRDRKAAFLKECEDTKLALLWQILFETDITNTDVLKERIYRYGSNLKTQDYFGREVFLCLVALLNLVIK